KSTAFNNGDKIPSKFTCDGENISPELSWYDAPEGTKSFALMIEDPDAPGGLFLHWILFNIPADINSLPEDTTSKSLPEDAVQGTNHFSTLDYGGPCPPSGMHHYYFRIYALDIKVKLSSKAGR